MMDETLKNAINKGMWQAMGALLFVLTVPLQAVNGQSYTLLNGAAAGRMQSLSVSSGNTYVLDLSSGSCTISGDLSNAGAIYVVSSNPATRNVSITASNVFNNRGAMLTSMLPPGGLPGLGSVATGLALSIRASNSILNQGTISAVSGLNLMAPVINNSGTLATQAGNLNVVTANLVNSGIIQALQGSLQIANRWSNILHITNDGGTITAAGDLTINAGSSSSSSAPPGLLEITGGTLSASNIFLQCPGGDIRANVNRLDGMVSVASNNVQLVSSQGDLRIGTSSVTGKMTLAAGGDVDLSGLVSTDDGSGIDGGSLTVIAGGNIKAPLAAPGSTLSAGANIANGKVFLAAGTQTKMSGNTPVAGSASQSGGNVVLPSISIAATDCITIQAKAGSSAVGSVNVGDISLFSGPANDLHSAQVSVAGDGSVQIGNVSNQLGGATISSTSASLNLSNQNISCLNGTLIINANGLVLQSGVSLATTNGNVILHSTDSIDFGNHNSISASSDAGSSQSSSILVEAQKDVLSSGNNAILALGGNIQISSQSGNVNLGANDSLQSCALFGPGSRAVNLTISCPNGNLSLSEHTSMQSNGGNISLRAQSLTVGHDSDFAAQQGSIGMFAARKISVDHDVEIVAAGFNGSPADVMITSSADSINLGPDVSITAIGGNLLLQADQGNVDIASWCNLAAVSAFGTGGTATIVAGGQTIGHDTNVSADRGLSMVATTGDLAVMQNAAVFSLTGVSLSAAHGSVILTEGSSVMSQGTISVSDLSHQLTQETFVNQDAFASPSAANDTNNNNSDSPPPPATAATESLTAPPLDATYSALNGQNVVTANTNSAALVQSDNVAGSVTTTSAIPKQFDAGDSSEQVAGSDSNLVPISFVVGAAAPTTLVEHGEKSSDDSTLSLSNGEALLGPDRKIMVQTPWGTIYKRTGAVVLLSVNGAMCRVQDFADTKNSSVRFVTNSGQTLSILPGQELTLLASSDSPVNRIIGADGVARRSVKSTVKNGQTIVYGEFSILQCLNNHRLWRDVCHSPKRTDKRLVATVLKTAAALSLVVDPARGPFKQLQ